MLLEIVFNVFLSVVQLVAYIFVIIACIIYQTKIYIKNTPRNVRCLKLSFICFLDILYKL